MIAATRPAVKAQRSIESRLEEAYDTRIAALRQLHWAERNGTREQVREWWAEIEGVEREIAACKSALGAGW